MGKIECKVNIKRGVLTEAAKTEVLRLSAAIRGSMPKKGGRPDSRKGTPGWQRAKDARVEQAARVREDKETPDPLLTG